MAKITHPQDTLFKASFKRKEVVADFLQHRLPADIIKTIDTNTLTLSSTSFVNPALKNSYSDVVYTAEISGASGFIYFLLEQQTTPDHVMALRLLEYQLSLMRQHLRAGHDKLPPVISFVIYTGAKAYPYEKRLIDAFARPDLLYRALEHTFLIELNKEEEETIYQDGKAALAELVMREAHRRDYCAFLGSRPRISALFNGSPYGLETLLYIFERDPHEATHILAKIPNLGAQKQDEIMNALKKIELKGREQGISEGRQEGWQKGISEGRQEGWQKGTRETIEKLVRGMYAAQLPLADIARIAHLTVAEVNTILEKKHA